MFKLVKKAGKLGGILAAIVFVGLILGMLIGIEGAKVINRFSGFIGTATDVILITLVIYVAAYFEDSCSFVGRVLGHPYEAFLREKWYVLLSIVIVSVLAGLTT